MRIYWLNRLDSFVANVLVCASIHPVSFTQSTVDKLFSIYNVRVCARNTTQHQNQRNNKITNDFAQDASHSLIVELAVVELRRRKNHTLCFVFVFYFIETTIVIYKPSVKKNQFHRKIWIHFQPYWILLDFRKNSFIFLVWNIYSTFSVVNFGLFLFFSLSFCSRKKRRIERKTHSNSTFFSKREKEFIVRQRTTCIWLKRKERGRKLKH